jgi:hypothetical protein
MFDDIIDLLCEDETIQEKVLKPAKRKAYPILFGSVFFNLIILILLVMIIIKLNRLHITAMGLK